MATSVSSGTSLLSMPGVASAATSDAVPGLAAGLRAGAGRADVMWAPDLLPFDGFVGEHDPLAVRVLLLEQGEQRVAIVIVDLTSIFDELIVRIKSTLTAISNVPSDRVIVCASHTFSTPHIFLGEDRSLNSDAARHEAAAQAFETAVRAASQQAIASMQPARLGAGSGVSQINVNRDVQTPQGWWLGADDAGFSDHTLGVLRIDGNDGNPLAILMNYSVQPSVMDESTRVSGGRLMSSDLAGAAARHVEAAFPGSVAMFLIGAAGDQSPILQSNRHVIDASGRVGREDLHEAGFVLSDLLGEHLGGTVVRIAERIHTTPMPELALRRMALPATSQARGNMPVGPVVTYVYRSGGAVDIPVVFIRIGDLALVGIQPELAAQVGAHIREQSPFPATFIVTMVDGAAKYLPDSASYDRFTYEARSSPFARGTAEVTASAIVAILKNMAESAN